MDADSDRPRPPPSPPWSTPTWRRSRPTRGNRRQPGPVGWRDDLLLSGLGDRSRCLRHVLLLTGGSVAPHSDLTMPSDYRSGPCPAGCAMGKALVIVESPAKARTIGGMLGPDFIVESSVGHIRDLPRGADEVPAASRASRGRASASTSTTGSSRST